MDFPEEVLAVGGIGGLFEESAHDHRHRLQKGRPVGADLAPQPPGRVAAFEDERASRGDHRHECGQLEVDVRRGHARQVAVRRGHRQFPHDVPAGEDHVGVGHHDALGGRGRPRRVHDLRQVLGAELGPRREPAGLLGLQVRVAAGAVSDRHDDGGEPGEVACGERGFGDEHADLAFGEDVRAFGSREGHVERDDDGSDARQGEEALDELGPVAQVHGHSVALAHAEPVEEVRRPGDLPGRLGVGVPLDAARIRVFDDEEFGAGARSDPFVPHVAQRRVICHHVLLSGRGRAHQARPRRRSRRISRCRRPRSVRCPRRRIRPVSERRACRTRGEG